MLSSGMASQMRFLLFFECSETLGLVEGRLVSVPTRGNLTYLTRPSPVNKRGSWACLYKEDVLEAGKGMEKIVFTLPENLPQVLIVHGPPLHMHKSRRNDQQLGCTLCQIYVNLSGIP